MAEDADDFPSDSAVPDERASRPARRRTRPPTSRASPGRTAPRRPSRRGTGACAGRGDGAARPVPRRGPGRVGSEGGPERRRAARALPGSAPLDLCRLEGVWSLVYSPESACIDAAALLGFSRLLEGKTSPTRAGRQNSGSPRPFMPSRRAGAVCTAATQTITATQLVSRSSRPSSPCRIYRPSVLVDDVDGIGRADGDGPGTRREDRVRVRRSPQLRLGPCRTWPSRRNAFDALSALLTPDARPSSSSRRTRRWVRVSGRGRVLFVHERARDGPRYIRVLICRA